MKNGDRVVYMTVKQKPPVGIDEWWVEAVVIGECEWGDGKGMVIDIEREWQNSRGQ